MKKATAAWVRKAEEDLRVASQARRSKRPAHNGVCFHCQQCAEKYLKALLEELGVNFPRTHELDLLRRLLLPHHPFLRAWRRGLVFLTNFAVAVRYPGDDATKRQAIAALRWAARLRGECRRILGLRTR
jgi:HEPN domain-containing protein